MVATGDSEYIVQEGRSGGDAPGPGVGVLLLSSMQHPDRSGTFSNLPSSLRVLCALYEGAG